MIILLFGITLVLAQNNFQQDCNRAPSPELRQTCLNLQRMASNSRRDFQQQADNDAWPPAVPEHLQPGPIMPGSRGQFASHPYDCMTMTCLCVYFLGTVNNRGQCILRNNQVLTMAYRKEYRMLTEDERLRYHNAMTMLKRSGEYDRMGLEHQSVGEGSGAHSGPGFLPWHREYLKRFEIALRLIDPSVSIPYWDSVLDNYLPDPRDSIFFSPYFMGETDGFGNVVTGPWAFWNTLDGRNAILRALGQKGQLFTEATLASTMQQTNIEYVMAYTAPLAGCPFPINFNAVEYAHSLVHLWVGGHMEPPASSSNDPIFFSHHSFIDFVWELWRQMVQPRWALQYPVMQSCLQAYSPDVSQCADPQHFSYAPMRPYFNLINRDGLSNMYTDHMFRYAPRPGCSVQAPTCGSPYLFCDLRVVPHCVSKVKLGGNCIGFEGLDACFNSVCFGGQCVPGATPPPFVPRTQIARNLRNELREEQAGRQFVNCFNRNPCCELWASNGECQKNGRFMRHFCEAACRICRPAYNTSNECTDRHVACRQWSSENLCNGRSSQYMTENCRSSCRLCSIPKTAKCSTLSQVLSEQQKQTSTNQTKSSKADRKDRAIASLSRLTEKLN